jgi:hypothetical protein
MHFVTNQDKGHNDYIANISGNVDILKDLHFGVMAFTISPSLDTYVMIAKVVMLMIELDTISPGTADKQSISIMETGLLWLDINYEANKHNETWVITAADIKLLRNLAATIDANLWLYSKDNITQATRAVIDEINS